MSWINALSFFLMAENSNQSRPFAKCWWRLYPLFLPQLSLLLRTQFSVHGHKILFETMHPLNQPLTPVVMSYTGRYAINLPIAMQVRQSWIFIPVCNYNTRNVLQVWRHHVRQCCTLYTKSFPSVALSGIYSFDFSIFYYINNIIGGDHENLIFEKLDLNILKKRQISDVLWEPFST